jgi:hypothetical protein
MQSLFDNLMGNAVTFILFTECPYNDSLMDIMLRFIANLIVYVFLLAIC